MRAIPFFSKARLLQTRTFEISRANEALVQPKSLKATGAVVVAAAAAARFRDPNCCKLKRMARAANGQRFVSLKL